MRIGKLEAVPIKELWKHEEYDFSQWLANNIELLSERLSMSLTVVQLEKKGGLVSGRYLGRGRQRKSGSD